jgi:hypothetical protein
MDIRSDAIKFQSALPLDVPAIGIWISNGGLRKLVGSTDALRPALDGTTSVNGDWHGLKLPHHNGGVRQPVLAWIRLSRLHPNSS